MNFLVTYNTNLSQILTLLSLFGIIIVIIKNTNLYSFYDTTRAWASWSFSSASPCVETLSCRILLAPRLHKKKGTRQAACREVPPPFQKGGGIVDMEK